MATDICADDRFEIIKRCKALLIEATNIESSPEEMAVIDDILFRFWQIGWLNLIYKVVETPKKKMLREAWCSCCTAKSPEHCATCLDDKGYLTNFRSIQGDNMYHPDTIHLPDLLPLEEPEPRFVPEPDPDEAYESMRDDRLLGVDT